MNFIKDTDCTVDTPVIYGKEERPVYGKEVRFRPRVPGKRDTATDKKNYLPRLLPLENYDLIIVLFSGGKDSLGFTLDNKKDLETYIGDAESCLYPDKKAIQQILTGTFTEEDIYTNSWKFPAGAFKGSEGGPC